MRMHYYTTAGLTTVGFFTEDDSGAEVAAFTTTGVTETLAGRYTVDVPEGVTVNWYEGSTFIVSERVQDYARPGDTMVPSVLPLDASQTQAAAEAAIAAYDPPTRGEATSDKAAIIDAIDGKLTAGRLGKLDSLTFTTPGTVDAAVAEPDLGTDTCTLTINDENGDPVTDARVYVSSDVAGARHSRTKITDGLGQAAFDLTDGETYYRWAFSSTVEFTNPQAFVAVAD